MTKSTIRIDGHPDVQGNLVIEGEQCWSWRAEVPLRLDFGSEVWLTAAVGDHTYVGLARVMSVTIDDRDRALARLEGMSLLAVLDAPGRGGLIPVPKSERAQRLNGPMEARIRQCATDTSSDWAGKITIYPPEARELVGLIDEVRQLRADVALLAHRYELALKAIEGIGGTVTADSIRRAHLPEPGQATTVTRPKSSCTLCGHQDDADLKVQDVSGYICRDAAQCSARHSRRLFPAATAPNPPCAKCGSTLTACETCGEPAQCGESWCVECTPDGGFTATGSNAGDAR